MQYSKCRTLAWTVFNTRPSACCAAGGHGVEQNHTIALDYYRDAHDAGHWRAPYALGVVHQSGLGVPANCTSAWRYLETFIKERSSWTDQMELAVLAVDSGDFPFSCD